MSEEKSFFQNLGPASKAILFIALAFGAFFTFKYTLPGPYQAVVGTIFPSAKVQESSAPSVVAEIPQLAAPTGATSQQGTVVVDESQPLNMRPGCAKEPLIRLHYYAWNGNAPLWHLLGGAQSAVGSLACKYGLNIQAVRQEDPSKMREAMAVAAERIKKGESYPTDGVVFNIIMGDGSMAFISESDKLFKGLGVAKAYYAHGASHGEDAWMGDPEWFANIATAREHKHGSAVHQAPLISGVVGDGDWNIAIDMVGKNRDKGLCNNPDFKTYDPACLNWWPAASPGEAAEVAVAQRCEPRMFKRDGFDRSGNAVAKGNKGEVCVNSTVVWTPTDVIVVEKLGGLVKIRSTEENSGQMPATLIGYAPWVEKNGPLMEKMIEGLGQAAHEMINDRKAFEHAMRVSAAAYNENDASYWATMYNAHNVTDKKGLTVRVGGSAALDLAASAKYFGVVLVNGRYVYQPQASSFRVTHDYFGALVHQYHPDMVEKVIPVDQHIDLRYLVSVMNRVHPAETVATTTFAPAATIKHETGRVTYRVEFASGKASFAGDIETTGNLQHMLDAMLLSDELVELDAYTDSDGHPEKNLQLSEYRGLAVKQWLVRQSGGRIDASRIKIHPHGEDNPVAPNDTAANKALNRRVEFHTGSTS